MRHAVLLKIREKSLSWGEEPWASPLFHSPPTPKKIGWDLIKKGLLAPYPLGVNSARLCRFPPKGRKNGIDD